MKPWNHSGRFHACTSVWAEFRTRNRGSVHTGFVTCWPPTGQSTVFTCWSVWSSGDQLPTFNPSAKNTAMFPSAQCQVTDLGQVHLNSDLVKILSYQKNSVWQEVSFFPFFSCFFFFFVLFLVKMCARKRMHAKVRKLQWGVTTWHWWPKESG